MVHYFICIHAETSEIIYFPTKKKTLPLFKTVKMTWKDDANNQSHVWARLPQTPDTQKLLLTHNAHRKSNPCVLFHHVFRLFQLLSSIIMSEHHLNYYLKTSNVVKIQDSYSLEVWWRLKSNMNLIFQEVPKSCFRKR